MPSTIILAAFLSTTLALGLWAGRGVKTMKDYALANRSLGAGVLTITLLATFIGSGDLTFPFDVANSDLAFGIIDPLSIVFSFILTGLVIVPNMVYFTNCFTTGDLMEKLYGRAARILSGIVSLFVSILVVSTQLKAIGDIAGFIFKGLSIEAIILVVGFIVVTYTSVSGMRGVAYTDVLQFIIMVVMLFILTGGLLHQLGGLKVLIQQLPEKNTKFLTSPNLGIELKGSLFFSIIPTFVLTPPIIQRILMVKNKRQVKNMFFLGAFIYSIITALLLIIGLGAVVYSNNNLSQEFKITSKSAFNLVGSLGNAIFNGSDLLNHFILIGMIFVLSSTMDSFLHTAGISLIHDVVSPILNRRKIVINEIMWSRVATSIIGLISVYSALKVFRDTHSLSGVGYYKIGYYHAVFVMHLILFPLIVGVMGVKTDKKSFIAFISSYTSTVIITKGLFSLDEFTPFYISIVVGIVCFFASHFYQNKGFVMVDRSQGDWRKKPWLPTWSGFASKISSSIPTLGKLREESQGLVSEHGSEPLLFSIAFVVTSPIILLTIPHTMETLPLIALVYGIAIFLCSGLMIESIWASYLKPYFDLYWFLTLLFCLPFSTTLLFFSASNQPTVSIAVLVAFFLLMLLVDWKTFINLGLIGIGSSTMIYRYFSGEFFPSLEFEVQWQMAITLFTLLILGIMFTAKREIYNSRRLKQTQLFGSSIAHETRNYLGNSINIGKVLRSAIEKNEIRPMKLNDVKSIEQYYIINKKSVEDLDLFGEFLSQGGEKASSKIDLFLDAMRRPLIKAKREKTSIKKLIEESLKGAFFKDPKIGKLLKLEIKDDFQATILPEFFSHIMYNLVKNAYWHGGASQILIRLNSGRKTLDVLDNGRGISPKDQNSIFDLFYSGGSSSGIGLTLVKAIVESAGGKINVESKQGENHYTKVIIRFAS